MGDDLHINKKTNIFIANHTRLLRQKNLIQLIILIGNDLNNNSELQITIRTKNDVVPCPKRGDVTHALSEARC
jgi:hypothetical protein